MLLPGSLGCGIGNLPAASDGSPAVPPAVTVPAGQPPLESPTTAASGTATPTATATPKPRRRQTVSLAGLAEQMPVPHLPSTFAPLKPDPLLQEIIVKALEGVEGTYSVVVHNLVDGRYASLRPDHAYRTASLFKLAVLAAAYRERDAGRLDFQRLLVLEDEYVAYDLGTLMRLGLEPEDRVSVEDAVTAMIVVSDTPLALMVQDAADADSVRALVEAEGLTGTTQPLPQPLTTAVDMARLLEVIASGKGFTEVSRKDMLSLLLQESIRAGIAAGIPEGTALAHKTGNLENATHDVGIIWGPAGPYVLAILSDQPWTFDPVAQLSRAVYQYFAEKPSEPAPRATMLPLATPPAPAPGGKP